MSFRIEEKLYIKKTNLVEFRNFLLTKNPNQPYNSRIIKSLYFDNYNFDMNNDSIEGLLPRKKIRIRNYQWGNDKNYYIEKKYSSVEGRYKKRTPISNQEYFDKNHFGIFDEQYGVCFPKIEVQYLREYYIYNDIRITLDTNIQYNQYKRNLFCKDENIIVEIKTDYYKDHDLLIKEFPFQRIRFSKYCSGIELLNLT